MQCFLQRSMISLMQALAVPDSLPVTTTTTAKFVPTPAIVVFVTVPQNLLTRFRGRISYHLESQLYNTVEIVFLFNTILCRIY